VQGQNLLSEVGKRPRLKSGGLAVSVELSFLGGMGAFRNKPLQTEHKPVFSEAFSQ
jgi:hypothetical protein